MTPLDLLLIDQFTGGVNMPTAAQDGFVAVAKVSGGRVNLDYVDPLTLNTASAGVDPVYVEKYVTGWSVANSAARATIRATAGTLRTALIAALAANLTARVFVLPSGVWNWDKTQFLNESGGLRNNVEFVGHGTEIACDLAGATSGQVIMFMWNYSFGSQGAGDLKHDIHFRGIKFSLLNVQTSNFSLAVSIECATKCSVVDCEFVCTFADGDAETSGHQRWGFGLFGDSLGPNNGGGRDNFTRGIKLTNSQFQGCGAGRSLRNCSFRGFTVNRSNDFAVSVCSINAPNTIENVTIADIECFDVSGSGVVLAGGDGGTVGEGLSVVRNITIENIHGSGTRVPQLDFFYGGCVAFYGGIITENIVIDKIGNKLSGNTNASSNAFSLNIGGSPDQSDPHAWKGLTISNSNFGAAHDTDPKQAVIVACNGIDGFALTNVVCRGPRGVQLQNCDYVTINNLVLDDGTLEMIVNRNLTSVVVSNSILNRASSFLYGLWVKTASTNKNVASFLLSNTYLRGHSQPGLQVTLAGGTMAMLTSNVDVTGTLDTETLAGIVASSSSPGIVKDRASFGSGKGYVDVVIDLAAQSAGAVAEVSTTVAGALVGDTYAISTLTAIDSTIIFCDARCRVAGTVVWRLFNASGTPNPSSNTFRFALVARN